MRLPGAKKKTIKKRKKEKIRIKGGRGWVAKEGEFRGSPRDKGAYSLKEMGK